MSRSKQALRRLPSRLFARLPERWQGLVEFYLRPAVAQGFGPLNGQLVRQRIVERMIADLDVKCIVETGTYRGTTTEYFAAFGIPVLSVEVSGRYFAYARRRLAKAPNVSLFHDNSVDFLRAQAALPTTRRVTTLFYLDAHWRGQLPLAEELRIICSKFESSIVVIDDFEVPDDPAYAFDDYGPGRKLGIDYLEAVSTPFDLYLFFPAARASEESGHRRGAAIVTAEPSIAERLRSFGELRFFRMIPERPA